MFIINISATEIVKEKLYFTFLFINLFLLVKTLLIIGLFVQIQLISNNKIIIYLSDFYLPNK
jgi:hypothetical protein